MEQGRIVEKFCAVAGKALICLINCTEDIPPLSAQVRPSSCKTKSFDPIEAGDLYCL